MTTQSAGSSLLVQDGCAEKESASDSKKGGEGASEGLMVAHNLFTYRRVAIKGAGYSEVVSGE